MDNTASEESDIELSDYDTTSEEEEEENEANLLTDADIECVNNITRYNLDPAIRETASRVQKNYKPSSTKSQQNTAVMNHSTFRALVKQFGRDMFQSLPTLIERICTVAAKPELKKPWNESTAIRRLRVVSLYIEYNPDIYERCSGGEYDTQSAIELINEEFTNLTEKRQVGLQQRIEMSEKEKKLFVSIDATKKWLRRYWQRVGKTSDIEKCQNKLLPALYLYYPVRRNENVELKAKMIIRQGTDERHYTKYPAAYIDSRATAENQANDAKENYFLMTNDGVKIIYNTFKTSHTRDQDLNKKSNDERKPLRATERRHHKELLDALATSPHEWQYLFTINHGTHSKNATLRLQQSFICICNLPLGVDILRKMFIYHNRRLFMKKSERNQLMEEMTTSFTTVNNYYNPDIDENQIKVNEKKMKFGQSVIRLGPYDKAQKKLKIELLRRSRGILWDVVGRRLSWTHFKSSPLKLKVDGEEYIIRDVFADSTTVNLKKLSKEAKNDPI